jgi:aminopeptidase YwaD
MRTTTSIFFIAIIFQLSTAQNSDHFQPDKILEKVEFLASDSLKGRKPGTPESRVAAEYILDSFLEAGLTPVGENGFQYFDVVTSVEAGKSNFLSLAETEFQLHTDFIPLPFSTNKKLSAPAVFVGYGFDIKNDTIEWNDYEGFDVSGKWALILRGAPAIEEWEKVFESAASERFKVMTAKDKGAAGVIFINGKKFDNDDELIRMTFDRIASNAGIPVFNVKRNVVEPIFLSVNDSLAGVENKIAETKAPLSFWFNQKISAQSDVVQKVATTKNVVAKLEGNDPNLKHEHIVIGAHYDHLGLGGPGSGSRAVDTIAVHYGADDNASGVAGVISLAEYFAQIKPKQARSLVFVAFGAEEMGLLGSKYFVEHPLFDMENVVAMINFDMIGRLRENKVVSIGGTGTGRQSEEILKKLEKNSGLHLQFAPEGYGPSDHAAFYSKDIPVFFISTGAHEDYHTPKDDVSAINADGMAPVINFSATLLSEIANSDQRLSFQEAGPKTRQRHGSGYKVTLGIMPDFTGSDNIGLRVDAVRPDGPARSGGMLKGDVIIAINGKSVENIYDYMGRLKDLEAGQSINVEVLREGKKELLLIQL